MFGAPADDDFETDNVTAYTSFRFSWNPDDDVREIARDFCAVHFGARAADAMAEILLLSPVAYKYGIYIEPTAYGEFSSLVHMRLNIFPAKGFPELDQGKRHISFLRKIYLRCKPWLDETLMYLDHGLSVANKMDSLFQAAKPLLENSALAVRTENALKVTQRLIQTNTLYVKTFFAYFQYREAPLPENKQRLHDVSLELKSSMEDLLRTPGCDYELPGMEQLLVCVEMSLSDFERTERLLAEAPDHDGVKRLISDEQAKYKRAMEKYSAEAVKFGHWKSRVDGKDLILISGDSLRVKHLRFDRINEMTFEITKPLPREAVTVIPVDIQSRSYRPFILEQPSEENDFTVKVYLSDYPSHGYSWWEFDLYYIPKAPEEIGLAVPWKQ